MGSIWQQDAPYYYETLSYLLNNSHFFLLKWVKIKIKLVSLPSVRGVIRTDESISYYFALSQYA